MNQEQKYQLVVLNPGHFHAALVQKSMYPQIKPEVKVFAPKGEELKSYLDLISLYNQDKTDPTDWEETVYSGADYEDKALQQEDAGNKIVVLAGNNQKKAFYISRSVDAGMNVLADKPMSIDEDGYRLVKKAFDEAESKGLVLYDIMTERYALTNILQKILAHTPDVFGELEKGTEGDPAVVFKSVHHFYKEVSGMPLIRPTWYFDTEQQGEGIVDVTTHLIDLAQWACFPEEVFDLDKDIKMTTARHWPTQLSLEEFTKVTDSTAFPTFLQKDVHDGQLQVYANGEIDYKLKGVNVKVAEEWRFQAPKGSGDTYFSSVKGSKASLVILQDKDHNFKPTLYIKPLKPVDDEYKAAVLKAFDEINTHYPGVDASFEPEGVKVIIPGGLEKGHEQHFSSVVRQYLKYVASGKLPEWERSYMLAKYKITSQALQMVKGFIHIHDVN